MIKGMLCLFMVSVLLLISGPANAQRGTGEANGVAGQARNLPTVTLKGTVSEVKIGSCEQTTGGGVTGVHLQVKSADGRDINLHLGPQAALDDVLKVVKAGSAIKADAFRTDRMPQDAFVARSITVDNQAFQLRDENLRPRWAGNGMGGGPGRGQGMGMGTGGGRSGACWW